MQLIAQELVKVEPMKLPSGLLFYLQEPDAEPARDPDEELP